jgi:hypothetical protein
MQRVTWRHVIRFLALCLMLSAGMGAGLAGAAPSPQGGGAPVMAPKTVLSCGVNDSYGAEIDTTLTVAAPGVLANDGYGFGTPRFPSVTTTTAHGALSVASTGAFTYTPNSGYVGTDTFVYALKCYSIEGAITLGTATVTIYVYIPTPPSVCLQVDDAYTTPVNTTLTDSAPGVFRNDTWIDPHWFLLRVSPAAHGSATVMSDGTVTYIPDAGFVGTDSFTYTVRCNTETDLTATVTITVAPQACAAVNDSYTTAQNTALDVAAPGVLSNDMGTSPSVSFVGASPAHGSISQAPDGSLTYIPDAGFVGTDSYTYVIGCAGGSDSVGTVAINVTAPSVPNATPVAGN